MSGPRLLDPQTQALLDAAAASGALPTHQLSLAQARSAYLSRRDTLQPPPLPVGKVRDIEIDGPGGALKLRIYRPGADTDTNTDTNINTNTDSLLPALMYFHGGGFVVGNLDTHDTLCRALCNQARCVVVSVDYRLAPEHAYPAAALDCIAATRWAHANGAQLNIDTSRLAVGGDSAGGQLAAVVSQSCKGKLDLAFQLLIYPITDARMQSESIERNGQGYLLGKRDLAYYYDHYLAGRDVCLEPMASPLLAPDLSDLPVTLVLTAGFDPLHDEGLAYANALSQAGTKTQYVSFARQVHGFILMGRVIDEAQLAIDTCASALRRALHTESR